MIYHSLSACLSAIHRGHITLSEVDYVIASTQIPNRRMIPVYCALLQLPPEPCFALWDTGRIYQPTIRVEHPAHLKSRDPVP